MFAGCGGGGKSNTDTGPTGTSDPQAKVAAQAYLDAYTHKNAKAICRTLTPLVQRQLGDNKGTCVKTIRPSLKGASFPKLIVADAKVTGTKAAATITGSKRQVMLQKIGTSWKVYDGGS